MCCTGYAKIKVVTPLFQYLDLLPPFWLFFSTDKMETRLLLCVVEKKKKISDFEIWQGPSYLQTDSTD